MNRFLMEWSHAGSCLDLGCFVSIFRCRFHVSSEHNTFSALRRMNCSKLLCNSPLLEKTVLLAVALRNQQTEMLHQIDPNSVSMCIMMYHGSTELRPRVLLSPSFSPWQAMQNVGICTFSTASALNMSSNGRSLDPKTPNCVERIPVKPLGKTPSKASSSCEVLRDRNLCIMFYFKTITVFFEDFVTCFL